VNNFILKKHISADEKLVLKRELISISEKLDYFILLDSCLDALPSQNGINITYDFIAGLGASKIIDKTNNFFSSVDSFVEENKGSWIFAHLNYDLKNAIESILKSNNDDVLEFPDSTFFCAETTIVIIKDTCFVYGIENHLHNLSFFSNSKMASSIIEKTLIEKDISLNFITREEYNTQFNKIINHILHGDIYETNYCIPFVLKNANIDVANLFERMIDTSPAPFSTLYKNGNHWLLCSSPERYLCKQNNKLFSQPIKGTAPRFSDPILDLQSKLNLASSEKEKAENVMIVDLVRNDLSKIAKRNSVQVDELFGIYAFPQVFQMISTISANLKEDVKFSDIIKATFPMGSMTGAPKISAMQIIEKTEKFKRGIYSGTVGYISPDGNFDFNVVIRSIIYNDIKKTAIIPAGSAITSGSIAEQEYLECVLKASSNLKNLGVVLEHESNQELKQ
jgi:para-aminobenzoate synthetase component 1